MSFLKTAAEWAIQNSVLGIGGLSDHLGLTGKDGLIHDSHAVVAVGATGLVFQWDDERYEIPWTDVDHYSFAEDDMLDILFRGGFNLFVPLRCVQSKESLPDLSGGPSYGWCENRLVKPSQDVTGAEFAELVDAFIASVEHWKRLEGFVRSLDDAFWRYITMENVGAYIGRVYKAHNFDFVDDGFRSRLVGGLDDLFNNFCPERDPDFYDALMSEDSEALAELYNGYYASCVPLLRLKRILFGLSPEDSYIAHLMEKKCGGATESPLLGEIVRPEYATRREMIICTSKLPEIDKVFVAQTRKSDNSVLVVDAADLASIEGASLRFPVGHPRNGTTYLQHPYDPSCYYPLAEYNHEVLVAKFRELRSLVMSLGAFSIEGGTQFEQSRDKGESEEHSQSVSGEKECGSVSVKTSSGRSVRDGSSVFREIKCNETFIPNGVPHIPDGLLFLEGEPDWKERANAVLHGHQTTIDFSFTCKDTKKYNKKKFETFESQAKVLAASVAFESSDKFEEELEEMESTTLTIKANFMDVNGHRATDYKKVATENLTPQERAFVEYVKSLQRNKDVAAIDRGQLADTRADRLGIDPLRATELENMASVMID